LLLLLSSCSKSEAASAAQVVLFVLDADVADVVVVDISQLISADEFSSLSLSKSSTNSSLVSGTCKHDDNEYVLLHRQHDELSLSAAAAGSTEDSSSKTVRIGNTSDIMVIILVCCGMVKVYS